METAEAIYALASTAPATASFTAADAPVLTITSPTAYNNSLTPTVSWTTTTSDGSYRFVAYTSPQDMPLNNPLTPETLPPPPAPNPVVDTLIQSGGSPFTMPSGLNSVAKYYGYLQTTDATTGIPSLWTEVVFIIQLMSGDTTTLTATPVSDPTTGLPSAELVMTISAGDLTTAEFAWSADGGTTWVDVAAGLQSIASETCTLYDTSSPYNIPLMYRVRGVGMSGGQGYVTAWSASADVAEIPSLQWAIISPANISGSMALHRLPSSGATSSNDNTASPTSPAMPSSMGASFISDEWEQQGVFHPFGKSTATIIHGDLWQPEFTIDLFFLDPAEWAAFRAIREFQGVVLFKSDMEGALYWVTLGPDLNPGIMSEADRQTVPKRGLTVACTPTDPYVAPNPYVPTN